LAFTKEEKKALVEQYESWLKNSRAIYVLSYSKMNMASIDAVRASAREIGGEVHVVKNTLMKLALKNIGYADSNLFSDSSIVGFAFEDVPGLAKVLNKTIKDNGFFALKGGYLEKELIDAKQVVMLAELPSRDQVRAQLLALINTPATKLVRTITEPARGLAAVLKAYSEKQAAPAA
jgi:large subunit ribosomal protein L10